MINGFEKETHELSEFELGLIPILIAGLKGKHGKENAVTNPKIVRVLKELGKKTSEPRVRKMMHYIRTEHLVTNLIATNKGYYRATNQEEIDKYVEGLRQRVRSIEDIIKSFNVR